jgi:hypothetical protein
VIYRRKQTKGIVQTVRLKRGFDGIYGKRNAASSDAFRVRFRVGSHLHPAQLADLADCYRQRGSCSLAVSSPLAKVRRRSSEEVGLREPDDDHRSVDRFAAQWTTSNRREKSAWTLNWAVPVTYSASARPTENILAGCLPNHSPVRNQPLRSFPHDLPQPIMRRMRFIKSIVRAVMSYHPRREGIILLCSSRRALQTPGRTAVWHFRDRPKSPHAYSLSRQLGCRRLSPFWVVPIEHRLALHCT